MRNQPIPGNFWKWFDPRFKQMGTWAFILNRITAIGLTVYLALHLFMLSKLVQGPESYDSFIALAKSPAIKVGEMFVIAAVFIHGLNGIRIALTSLGIGVNRQKQMLVSLMTIAAIGTFYFAFRMFFGE